MKNTRFFFKKKKKETFKIEYTVRGSRWGRWIASCRVSQCSIESRAFGGERYSYIQMMKFLFVWLSGI